MQPARNPRVPACDVLVVEFERDGKMVVSSKLESHSPRGVAPRPSKVLLRTA